MLPAAPDPLHTLNTLPAAEVAELVDTRSRRYVARVLPSHGPVPLSQRFCFGDLTNRVDCGVDARWARPRFRLTAALLRCVEHVRSRRARRRARLQVAESEYLRRPGTGVVRALLVSVAVEIALGLLVVAGVALRGRA